MRVHRPARILGQSRARVNQQALSLARIRVVRHLIFRLDGLSRRRAAALSGRCPGRVRRGALARIGHARRHRARYREGVGRRRSAWPYHARSRIAGGVSPVFTPNPFAAGIPTSTDPILLDISASYTTNGMTARLHKAGEKLAHPWVQDARGNATTDPGVLFSEPKGTLLPLGGLEGGHKGYALALLVEALTAGLAGFGRADPSEGWGATVFVQAIDPAAFGGCDGYARPMDLLVDACHGAIPRPGVERVRVPGENGLRRYREQLANGVALVPSIMPALQPWAEKHKVAAPLPCNSETPTTI